MEEKSVEKILGEKVKKLGCLYYKFVSPGTIGVPDRIIICPNGLVIFVELKKPGKSPRPNQKARIKEMAKNYASVVVVDSIETANRLVRRIELTGIHGCPWTAK